MTKKSSSRFIDIVFHLTQNIKHLREHLLHYLGYQLVVGFAGELLGSQSHQFAHLLDARDIIVGNQLLEGGGDFLLRHLGGQELRDDFQLGELFGGEVLATAVLIDVGSFLTLFRQTL